MCGCELFFFFKQKTAYDMRISDWSSDVCSSDLSPIILHSLSIRARCMAMVRRAWAAMVINMDSHPHETRKCRVPSHLQTARPIHALPCERRTLPRWALGGDRGKKACAPCKSDPAPISSRWLWAVSRGKPGKARPRSNAWRAGKPSNRDRRRSCRSRHITPHLHRPVLRPLRRPVSSARPFLPRPLNSHVGGTERVNRCVQFQRNVRLAFRVDGVDCRLQRGECVELVHVAQGGGEDFYGCGLAG